MKPNTLFWTRPLAMWLLMLGTVPVVTMAGVTDLSNAPLSSGVGGVAVVKPNIAFVVDDSGSMDYENMPDDSNSWSACFGWYKYNTIAYNPNYIYKPPFKIGGTVYSDGVTRFADASFTAALKDGYFTATQKKFDGNDNGTVNLSTSKPLTYSSTNYYYSVKNSNLSDTSCGNSSQYSLVTSSASIAAPTGVDAKTNYANWYSYYRNRAGVMKAAAGEAFRDLDESKFRIGLFFLNSAESGSAGTPKNNDLKIADFMGSAAGTQRHDWYTKLYGSRGSGSTPLRGALSRMGRMYAGQISGWDPVQYSCQQNFTILSTDGQWNTGNETTSYGPKTINGSDNVGDQDKGATVASAAQATINTDGEFGSSKNKRCYKATSLTVVSGGVTYDLLGTPNADDWTCPSGDNARERENRFGTVLTAAINAQTATTGFSAELALGSAANEYANTITIKAPVSLGAITVKPALTWERIGGSQDESATVSSFGGGATASAGADKPYKDVKGASNTLADVAYYYYVNDLRTSGLGNCSNTIGSTTYTDLCKDNVLGTEKDKNAAQHMTTFTLGLGVNGTITYENGYETAPNIDGVTQYFDIANGTADWPDPSGGEEKIDDLWHAAVNGRGTYYNASNAQTLRDGLQAALAGVQARTGSSAAAATSNLEPVAGDNYVYVALYRTQKWDGDLKAFEIDPATGALSGLEIWSAQARLDAQYDTDTKVATRKVVYFNSGATDKLKDFTFANLQTDSLNSHFENICDKTPAITQCGAGPDALTATQKTVANNGDNLVKYLRGSSTHEDEASNAVIDNRVFRSRDHLLGDTVNAVPVYMKKPPFTYDKYDTSYATFKADKATRPGTVFVAANDGMLHAFNAESTDTAENQGKERWSYVPRPVMSQLWNLADTNYGNNHRYFVDGSPTVADICTDLKTSDKQLCKSATDWKTIVVGGLNKGGCGYYALDVTDPTNPKGLWEFTNANLGYTYGNPVVGKAKDGRWVVIFSSGYNNYPSNGCGSTGDGNGHVFVVDAATGVLLSSGGDIATYTTGSTPAGTAATPSGLGKLNAWIANPDLPIIDRLYGGDMLGNLWRIDFDANHAPTGKEAVLLAQLKDDGGNTQPITTKPELAEMSDSGVNRAIVMVGTGKYLGTSDLADLSQQSIYAIKDSLGATGISDIRGSSMIERTLTETTGTTGKLLGATIRTVSGSALNWATADGWYMDLNPASKSPGERVNVDMSLQFNILTVAANVPANNACEVGGSAYLYFLDMNTGKNLSTSIDGMAGVRLSSNALVAGIKTLRLTSGKTVTVVTDTAGGVSSEDNPSATGGGSGVARRTTWREIPN